MQLKAHSPFGTQHSALIQEALRDAVRTLQAAHIESASIDARLLLEHALGLSREQLLLRLDDLLTPAQMHKYDALVARRVNRQPMAQIIGSRDFFGLTFKVTPSVLDPRPDSETLVETVLKRTRDNNAPLNILDLGTGTGCLLLTLLYEFKHARGIGVDVSNEALEVAKENALRLGLNDRASFIQSHWCMQVEGTFDIILSNPPYIPTQDIFDLQPEVADHEPKLALDGGADGLSCYRAIIASLKPHLASNGMAVVEFGLGQQFAIETLVKENHLKIASVVPDLQGIARCIVITH